MGTEVRLLGMRFSATISSVVDTSKPRFDVDDSSLVLISDVRVFQFRLTIGVGPRYKVYFVLGCLINTNY